MAFDHFAIPQEVMMIEPEKKEVEGVSLALPIQNVVLRPPAAAVAAPMNVLEMQNYRIRAQPRPTESESSFYQILK